jgi:hypothetical protein
MPTMMVPTDPRPQFTTIGLALAHAFGGGPSMDQVQQILPNTDLYIQPNSWPKPRPSGLSGGGGFSGLAASQAAPETTPRTAAQALWPNLPSG